MCDLSGDCRDVVRCDQAGSSGAIRLASIRCPSIQYNTVQCITLHYRCPSGLAFDLSKQICDWKAKV